MQNVLLLNTVVTYGDSVVIIANSGTRNDKAPFTVINANRETGITGIVDHLTPLFGYFGSFLESVGKVLIYYFTFFHRDRSFTDLVNQ